MRTVPLFRLFFASALAACLPLLLPGQHENATFRLTQSTAAYELWTCPPADRVFKDAPVPSAAGSEVKLYAARNEFEPFVVVVRPASSGNVAVTGPSFGGGIGAEIFQVRYVNVTTATDYLGRTGDYPDPLWPVSSGGTVAVTAGQNTAFWFSVYVPATTAPGDYTASVTLGGVSVPVRLHVFSFTLPETPSVESQMNFSHEIVLTRYGVPGYAAEYWFYVDRMKQFLIDHRLTPTSVLWSGGLTTNGAAPYIDYDCSGTFTDNDGIWGFEDPAGRYLDGAGLMNGTFTQPFNGGAGFPSFMAAGMRNNDASADQRPDAFCGLTRSASDWYTANNPTSAYNQKWFQYVTAMRNYLSANGYLPRAYYYIANEPQDQADYDAVAWYSRYLKQAAPDLKLMVSEEAKPGIFGHANYVQDHQIDIWLAHLGTQFDPDVAQERMKNHGENSWIYFLKSTYLPRFNPVTLDHPGAEAKLAGWFLWKYRLRGLAYYAFNDWGANPWTSPNPYGQNGELFLMYPPSTSNTNIVYGSNNHRFVPSIRLELLRDGLEDFEYLRLLSGGTLPQPGVRNAADPQVDKVVSMPTAYTRDSDFLYNLRRVIGLKVGGEAAAIPEIAPVSAHPRSDGAPGNYYLNFQDPAGQPADNPLIVNGHTYLKIGNNLYDAGLGYGWTRASEVPWSSFYTYWDEWVEPEPKKLLGSGIINDWGREDVFDFDLPNGTYKVTVRAGYRSGTRTHRIRVEGTTFLDDETTTGNWITRTKTVTVKDKKLTVQMGMYGEISFINSLDVEAVDRSPLLWTRPGEASLWAVDALSGAYRSALGWTLGGSWTAAGYTSNGDGTGNLLWTPAGGGQASLWSINESTGAFLGDRGWVTGGTWRATSWLPLDDGTAALLWTPSGGGSASLWRVDAATGAIFGALGWVVGGTWSAQGLSSNGDGTWNLLWTPAEGGSASLWRIDAVTGALRGDVGWYGAGDWKATAYAPNGDGTGSLLWTSESAGAASVWFIDATTGAWLGDRGWSVGGGWTAQAYAPPSAPGVCGGKAPPAYR